MDPNIHIRPFVPGDGKAFRELNELWITRYFVLEPADVEALSHPYEHYIEPGGEILMVLDGATAIGCCALINEGHGVYEVSKITMREDYRGLGLGRRLLQSVIDAAKAKGASKVFLVTNSSLGSAVHLYESVGFQHVPRESLPQSPYQRGNVFMAMEF